MAGRICNLDSSSNFIVHLFFLPPTSHGEGANLLSLFEGSNRAYEADVEELDSFTCQKVLKSIEFLEAEAAPRDLIARQSERLAESVGIHLLL